jgi:hypothetical protein
MTLEELIVFYGSDKASNGYVPAYLKYLGPIRDRIANFLEVGIGTMNSRQKWNMDYGDTGFYRGRQGASLRAWRDWLSGATIWGLDPQRDAVAAVQGELRIIPILGNSTDAEIPLSVPTLQAIVDDGSHDLPVQIETARIWHRNLDRGGIYIIEDVQGNVDTAPLLESARVALRHLETFTYTHHGSALVVFEKQ